MVGQMTLRTYGLPSVLTGSGDLGGDGRTNPFPMSVRRMVPLIRMAAEADVAVIAMWRDSSLPQIDGSDPLDCELDLSHSLFHQIAPTKEPAHQSIMELLLAGDVQWCRTIPPPGFAHFALITLPGRRFCAVANRSRHRLLDEPNLTKAVALGAAVMSRQT